MDKKIFEDWFKTKWVPEVRDFLKSKGLPQKAVLLLENAPSHPNESILKRNDGLRVAKLLPANVPSLIQPMDQGVISLTRSGRLDNLDIPPWNGALIHVLVYLAALISMLFDIRDTKWTDSFRTGYIISKMEK